MQYHYKSHAKVNLFLKVLGKRSDGYHDIQSLFQLICLYDEISFKIRKDNKINLKCNIKNLEKNNLIFKVIDKFKIQYRVCKIGLDIILKKNIPLGAGLGGGSSNAAITFLALNDIYHKKISKKSLCKSALSLGADIPFFINNKNAWVEGKGEIITNIYLKPLWIIIIFASHEISTAEIYANYKISGLVKKYTYDDYMDGTAVNVFEKIVSYRYPNIKKSLKILSKFGHAKMTGTGGSVFVEFKSYEEASDSLSQIPKSQNAIIIKSLI